MKTPADEAVVITGCGWVTPFAVGSICDVLGVACEADTDAPAEGYWAVPDQIRDDYPDFGGELKADRGAFITAVALEHARRDASLGLDAYPSERVGMVLGCALAGQLGMIDFANEVRAQTPRFVSPLHFPQTVGNYISGALARNCDIRGPNSTIACGAASGLDAVVEAYRLVAAGKADIVFAGGTEQLSPELVRGLDEPGVCFSEGACLVVVECVDGAAARGIGPRARITRAAWGKRETQLVEPSSEAIVSGAIHAEPGAILVEHWIGRCLGVLGTAAVAVAIGAADGLEVPIIDPRDPRSVIVESLGQNGVESEGDKAAIIFADTDGGSRTILEITVPT